MRNEVARRYENPVFVVPFFLDGRIDQIRVYSDVLRAQAALRRYVGYRELLAQIKERRKGRNKAQAVLAAYGAIERTRYAGTAVYEVDVDSRHPVRRGVRRSTVDIGHSR
jgi:hypothetical protein